MSDPRSEHLCKIRKESSNRFLPPIADKRNYFLRIWRWWKKQTLISERNPRCASYYRSHNEIVAVRELQAARKSPIIHPFSNFRLYYEMFMVFGFLFNIVYFPIDAAFEIHLEGKKREFRHINLAMNILNMGDLFIRFLTGYADRSEKNVVMDPWKIAKNYITRVHFIPDIVAAIPDPSFYLKNWKLLRLFDMILISRVSRITTTYIYIDRSSVYLNIKNSAIVRFVKIAIICILTLHWFACVIFMVPQIRQIMYGEVDKDSWLRITKIFTKPRSTQYIECLYRSTSLILGINLEAYIRKCWEEVFIQWFCYCCGKILTCFMIVLILRILLGQKSLESKYQEIMSEVESFMSIQKLPNSLREKLVENYIYKYNYSYFKETKIDRLLSDQLKKEVQAEYLRNLVVDVPLFQDVPQHTLLMILSYLKSEIFLPNDIIIKAGTPGDCIYFLASGTVGVTTPSGKEVCHLHDGAYFGEVCLITSQKARIANVFALEICEVYRMTRRGFLHCFKGNPVLWKRLTERALERIELTHIYEDIYKREVHEKYVAK